jgi:hypothetical protein
MRDDGVVASEGGRLEEMLREPEFAAWFHAMRRYHDRVAEWLRVVFGERYATHVLVGEGEVLAILHDLSKEQLSIPRRITKTVPSGGVADRAVTRSSP